MDSTESPATRIGRRRFLGWSLTGSAALVTVGIPTGAEAATNCDDTIQVFMLESNWGYPRGPHAKTHLFSRASKRAAQNRIALSQADAEAMNLHLCSFAPAVARTVRRSEFMALWAEHSYTWTSPWSGLDVRLVDLRHVTETPDGARRWIEANETCVAPDTTTATPGTNDTAPARLASTGADAGLARLSAGLLAVGAAMVALARRRTVLATSVQGTECCTRPPTPRRELPRWRGAPRWW